MKLHKAFLAAFMAATLLVSGCAIKLGGYREITVGKRTHRIPRSAGGPIQSEVRPGPGTTAVLHLTKVQEEEIRTVELRQMSQRRFDLTGMALGIGIGGFLLFILAVIAMATSDGSSSSSSWDWD
jgi:hypothetical protein